MVKGSQSDVVRIFGGSFFWFFSSLITYSNVKTLASPALFTEITSQWIKYRAKNFVSHTVSIVTTQLYHCRTKESIEDL